MKKTDNKPIDYLTNTEMQPLLDAPDPQTPSGIRDRAMLHLCFAAGLMVSELVGLSLSQLELQPQPSAFAGQTHERYLTITMH